MQFISEYLVVSQTVKIWTLQNQLPNYSGGSSMYYPEISQQLNHTVGNQFPNYSEDLNTEFLEVQILNG